MDTEHIHSASLRALLALSGEDKMEIARRASISPGHLRDLETFRNRGTSPQVRERVAKAFAHQGVTAASITCWCDRPGGTCRSVVPA